MIPIAYHMSHAVRRPIFRSLTGVAVSIIAMLLSPPLAADTYYVAPTGNDSNPGSLDEPFLTMARGQQAASAGDTVYFRGGTYLFTSSTEANGVSLNKSGSSGNRIQYWAYEDEIPVFDFSGMTALSRITGLRVTASWIHLKGLEIKLVPQNINTENESWGIHNVGSNNIFEMLNLHHNMGPGFFLAGGANNLILNCDSHHNYDPMSRAGDGENADGFGCHTQTGDTGNVFRGIRAWWNTDDGYDSINAQEACLVENSWAWYNGYLPDTMMEPMRDPDIPPGNGNGFKLGGFGLEATQSPPDPPEHTIRFSVAFMNQFAGFFANYHTSGNIYYNNTAFMNVDADFNMLGLNGVNTSVLRNNVAYGPSPTANLDGTDDAFNSWNLPVEVSEADFQSISITGMDGPRQPDGSLPIVPFMRLLPDSDLIDQGEDLGLPFNGAAPDLGAFESDGSIVGGAGGDGTGGAGNVAGSGGSEGDGGAGDVAGAGGSDESGGAGNAAGAMGGSAGAMAGADNTGGTSTGGTGTGGASVATGGEAVSGGSGPDGAAAVTGAGADNAAGASGASAGTLGTAGAPIGGTAGNPPGADVSGTTGGAQSTGQTNSTPTPGQPAAPTDEAGCGCRVTHRSRPEGFLSWAMALFALAGRKRRREKWMQRIA